MYEAKLPIEAATMTRTALDSLFMLGAALYDPEIEGKLESQHMASGGRARPVLAGGPNSFCKPQSGGTEDPKAACGNSQTKGRLEADRCRGHGEAS